MHACMHDSCTCIAWLTVYACLISGVLNYMNTVQVSIGVGGRHLAMSLYKLKDT